MANPLPNRTEELPDRKYYDPDTAENWADPLEAVIEEVSANSIVSGTNRGNFDPLDGQLFIPTNGGDWFLGNGSGWENLGPIGDIGDHTNDTTNPHSVTSDQVGSPSDAEFSSHTGDATNPHAVTDEQVIGGTAHYVRAESDLQPLRDGADGTFIVLGDVEITSTLQLDDGQALVGLGGSSRILPSADFNIIELIPAGYRQSPHVGNLVIDIDAGSVMTWTSAAIRLERGRRYEGGPPYVRNVTIFGETSAGTGATGILFDAFGGSGISWVTMQDIRIAHLDYGVRLTTDNDTGGSWINANTLWDIHPMDCRVGLQFEREPNAAIDGNTFRITGNGNPNIDRFFDIDGDMNTIYGDIYDSYTNALPWGLGRITGIGNRYVAEGENRAVHARLEDNGHMTEIAGATYENYKWLCNPSLPGWLTSVGTGTDEYIWGSDMRSYQLTTGGADGNGVALRPDGLESIYQAFEYPHLRTAFSLLDTAGTEVLVGLRTVSGEEAAILADPTDQRATGITGNFAAYSEIGDGTEFADTGVPLDTGIHYITLYQGRGDWGLGISMDGERHLRHTSTSEPTRGYPNVAITQRGAAAVGLNVRHGIDLEIERRDFIV